MKAYKGFNKDMKCRGFQFREGETYHEETALLCNCGFHACEMPLDVLSYYAPGNGSIYREVELEGVSNERHSDDSKVCATTIKIGAEIGLPGLAKAQIEWVKNKIGFDDAIKKATDSPDEHATGDYGAASATGYQGAASATGAKGAASATGDYGAASATGYQGAASATGDYGAASATGDYGAASATGAASVALASGVEGKVKGALGCAIFAVERGEWDGHTYPIISVAAAIVDGERIKADTFYKVEGGEFIECR